MGNGASGPLGYDDDVVITAAAEDRFFGREVTGCCGCGCGWSLPGRGSGFRIFLVKKEIFEVNKCEREGKEKTNVLSLGSA